MKLSRIILYDEPSIPEIDVPGAAKFAEDLLGIPVEARGSVLGCAGRQAMLDILSAEITDIFKPLDCQSRTASQDAALQNLTGSEDPSQPQFTGYDRARLFDGFKMQDIISGLVPDDEASLDVLSVAFLDMLTCTYSSNDFRYHARSIICANPAVISTAGMVVAPARPRQYVLDSMRLSLPDLERAYAGRYVKRRDSRLPLVAKGYLLQAVFHAMGEDFCSDNACPLFNAHWQEDLIRSHVRSGKLCERHDAMLQKAYGKSQDSSYPHES